MFAEQVQKMFTSIPEYENSFQLTGSTFGFSGVILKPWSERKRSSIEIQEALQGPAATVAGLNVIVTTPEPLPSGGQFPIELVIRSTADHREMMDYATQLVIYANTEANAAGGAPTFYFADSDLKFDLPQVEAQVRKLELKRMFRGEMDSHNAYLDIQAGAGGTEAQDWAQMLMRMYLKWAANRGFSAEVIDSSPGEVAGMKSATIEFRGDHAYGWLRTETGVHRLVRKSPFDSGNRRHTSFASVFVSPEIDDDINIDINPADLEMDVYRSSGAGGQHVNKTESAVRIRHMPSGIVVACQNERSQHKNRATAMKMLKAKLYELEVNKRNAAAKVLEDSKSDVSWGHQIRSYVLDQSRIKDLRTDVEIGNTTAVLDGDLDPFLEASLKAGL
jgi:peptide chain release factor 2